MAGTKAGGIKARATNLALHGTDFYMRIGAKGGRNGHTGGFASQKIGKDGLTGQQRAEKVGAIGGKKSSRAGIGTGESKIVKREIKPWGEE